MKISQLPAASPIAGGEQIPLVQAGQTRRAPAGQAGGLATLGPDGTIPAAQLPTDAWILTSPNGHRWRITITNNGQLTRSDLDA